VDHNFFAALRLGEKKKEKNKSRKVGKAQRVCPRPTAIAKRKTLFLPFKNPIPRKLPELPRHPHTAIEGTQAIVPACELLVVSSFVFWVFFRQAQQRIVAHIGGGVAHGLF
jgi:hypothetical protein